jgi:hypothetical protein
MAVIEGGVSATVAGVGAEDFKAIHTVRYPVAIGSGGAFRLGATSGTMNASLGLNSEIFQFRYVTAASRVALVYKVAISAGANVAASAAALVAFRLSVARSWTAAGSAGTRITFASPTNKLRTSHSLASEVNDAGISTTGALTAGTKTLDTNDHGVIVQGIGTGAITTAVILPILPPKTALLDADGEGQHPLVLANQEGFVIRTGANAFPAGMTWHFGVEVLWLEVANF